VRILQFHDEKVWKLCGHNPQSNDMRQQICVMLLLLHGLLWTPTLGEQSLPLGRTSYIECGKLEDVSFAGAKRILVSIIIPLGRTPEEVRATLTQAAITIGTRERARATYVRAYRPQDKACAGPWTVGLATYAPNGKWEDAVLQRDAPMAVTIARLGKLYFQHDAEVHQPQKGEQAFLKLSNAGVQFGEQFIEISKKRDSWEEADILARIPPRTPIAILERHESPLSSDALFVRYFVRLQWRGKIIQGWVHGDEIAR
jgi:hypothetical protein